MLLTDKAKRLKKDVFGPIVGRDGRTTFGHKGLHEERALSKEEALAKFTGAFQVARLPLPKFAKDASVAAMFAEVDKAIKGFEETAKKNPGAKEAS